MDNLYIYNQVRSVPQHAQKDFNNGSFAGTDINPMWRIKTLTEQFGPCGIGWYYEVLSERAETYGETVMAIVDLNLYIKVDGEWSKPIFGTGGNSLVKVTKQGKKASDEGYKMALTDALSVACKALGIGADIYFDKDVTKYDYAQPEEKVECVPASEPLPPWDAIKAIEAYCKRRKLKNESFGAMRKALIAGGILPEKPFGNLRGLNVDQYTELIRAIESNYPDALVRAS